MVETYQKKVANIEKQLKLAKIGYREEVLKLANLMARTSREESDVLMQQINEYADAIMALQDTLKDARDSLMRAQKARKELAEEKSAQ